MNNIIFIKLKMGCSGNSSVRVNDESRKNPQKQNDNSNLIIESEKGEYEKNKEVIKEKEKEEKKIINSIIEDNKKNVFNEDNEDNKIIVPPAVKEFTVEGNDTKVSKNYKKRTFKGLTILENVKQYFPENIERDYIKDMVNNALGGNIVNDKSEYIKGKNLTKEQVEGIIDVLFKIVSENENVEKNEIEDERLNDIKVNIGFYDANKENIRKFIFKGKNPTDEEVENTLNQFNSGEAETKILAVEIEDQ